MQIAEIAFLPILQFLLTRIFTCNDREVTIFIFLRLSIIITYVNREGFETVNTFLRDHNSERLCAVKKLRNDF